MRLHLIAAFLPSLFLSARSINFPFENVQLTQADVQSNPDVKFASNNSVVLKECKTFPGDTTWPSDSRWNALNRTVDGALIKTVPPGSPCYTSQPNFSINSCSTVRDNFATQQFHMANPSSVFGDWTTGATCPPTTNSSGTCTIGGYPVYVVNATTVKQIQAAVNFARNNQIRLIIKNTGHDFLGRSAGAGAISVWTHHLKQFEYLPNFRIGQYRGRAARVGAGLQSFDLFTYMKRNNITVIAPQDISVGTFGGYMQGGGHSWLGAKYSLMADQVLSVQLVTADGKFITADPTQNEDLFYAVRGGGGSTFGIVTSAIIKAYPAVSMATVPITFTTASGLSNEVFWRAMRVWFADLGRTADNGGFSYQWIRVNTDNDAPTYTFTNDYYFPDTSPKRVREILAPLYAQFRAVGVTLPSPKVTFYSTYYSMFAGNVPNGRAGGSRFIGRLWPRENLEKPALLDKSMESIRAFVEEGCYTFHCVAYNPTLELAGYPGNTNAVNTAFRKAIMHVTGFDSGFDLQQPPEWQRERYARLNSFTQRMRDATPGAGAYMNEVDVEEPNWEQSLYGGHWTRLSTIKRQTDPWMVFYARHGVGSEAWEVRTPDGLPTQNGKLCRV